MVNLIKLDSDKTYATEENAIRAVEKVMAELAWSETLTDTLRYFIHRNAAGRFFPVFVGETAVLTRMFMHFTVVS